MHIIYASFFGSENSGLKINPIKLPQRSFTVAVIISPPTFSGSSKAVAPRLRKRLNSASISLTPQ
ncbi:hypothetical protein GR160_14695 [Flavobacterium sp. Sd200]|nr:hypothetical protein [Flavobacterium sp. Sd200]